MSLRSLWQKLILLTSTVPTYTPPAENLVETPGEGHESSSTVWKGWVCATVIALFGISTLEREHQLFYQLVEAPDPVGRDFAVYYVAGRVASGEGEGRLYYSPSGNKTARSRELLQGSIPSNTAWSNVAASSLGRTTTTYYIYPPFFAVLFSPLARLRPRDAYFLWRGLSLAMLVISANLILRSFLPKKDLSVVLIATIGVLSFFPFCGDLVRRTSQLFDFVSLDPWILLCPKPQNCSLSRLLRDRDCREAHTCDCGSDIDPPSPVEVVSLILRDRLGTAAFFDLADWMASAQVLRL